MSQSKKCKQCGELKILDLFPKSETCKDGRRGTCKECKKNYLKKYNEDNKKHIKKVNKAYHEKNKEIIKLQTKEYYEKHKKIKPNTRYQDLDNNIRGCVRCGEVKDFDCFPKCSKSDNGHTWVCKSCTYKRKKEWEIKNEDVIKEKNRLYRIKTKERRTKYNYEYHREHRDHKKQYNKKWQEENKESNRIKSREYRSKNRARRYQYEIKYKHENQDKIRERRIKNRSHHNMYIKHKKATDLNFKIACILRGRFKVFMKSKGIKPNIKTLDLVGCSLDYFKNHIESQFTEGMSWDKMGIHGIHLDHIIPLSSFDLTKESEQKKAMHWSNFQPLWAKDNLQKGAKIDWSPNE